MPSRKHPAAGAPADAARPSRYSSELARAICDAAASGESLTDICARPDRPDRDVVSRWLVTNADFQAAHARSLGNGGPIAGPNQAVHTIDLPKELENVSADDLHRQLKSHVGAKKK